MTKIVDKKKIVEQVKKEVRKAKKEILVTMLLSEELKSPLPTSYHELLARKVERGVVLKRLGFGSRGEYVKINKQYEIDSKNYFFRYSKDLSKYRRLLIIDRKKIFFKEAEVFFETQDKEAIESFTKYFIKEFKKGKL